MISPSDLALHELSAVVNKPADRGVGAAGELSVLFSPADHTLGGVNMGNPGPRGRGCHSSSAGVGEQVQYTDLGTLTDPFADQS